MEQHEDLHILGQDLNAYLNTIKVSRWEHFAKYNLEEILAMPAMTIEQLKTISRRLHLKGLDLIVTKVKLEEYYQGQHHMSFEQIEREQLLDTSIEEFFGWQPKIINNLKREHIRTLRDLASLDISEVIKFKSIGVRTLSAIQNQMRKHGVYFTNKTYPPKPVGYRF